MKNIIYCVIDAFCYDNINWCGKDDIVTPFLSEMSHKYYSLDNVYSIAPYTEASLVSMLGDERCLENGGYLFGNATVEHTLFEQYKEAGYKTIYEYAPYVYSKSYLRGVDKFFYSRMYSLAPLYDYRLEYFRTRKDSISQNDLEVCIQLVAEAIDTWIRQIELIIDSDDSTILIRDKCINTDKIVETKQKLQEQLGILNQQRGDYIKQLFCEWKTHILWMLNVEYLEKQNAYNAVTSERMFNQLHEMQKKCMYINRKQRLDFRYFISTLFNCIDGKKDFCGLLKNYLKLYFNKSIDNYLSDLRNNVKPEIGMHRMFEYSAEIVKKYDADDIPYLLYLQPQDFHLPSVFHSFDCNDIENIEMELNQANEFIKKLPEDFRGNVLAAMSAHYCDNQIKQFYEKCKNTLKHDFLFIVTADHGYPCFDNPPRPYIYNQTYSEAFHVPFIVINQEKKVPKSDDYLTIIDANKYILNLNKSQEDCIETQGYILTEHAGPGCPIISENPIWYTYIDGLYRVSIREYLGTKISKASITDIFDLRCDKHEKYNLRNRKDIDVDYIIKIVNARHMHLSSKFNNNTYLKCMVDRLNENGEKAI